MSIRVACSGCGSDLVVPSGLAGKSCTCPTCGASVAVGGLSGPAPTPRIAPPANPMSAPLKSAEENEGEFIPLDENEESNPFNPFAELGSAHPNAPGDTHALSTTPPGSAPQGNTKGGSVERPGSPGSAWRWG